MTDAAADEAAQTPPAVEADARRLIDRLIARGWTVGVAESLTGGLVVASLVSVPGASAAVRGGVVAYATELKRRLLGVDAALLAAEGPVHPEVARQMATGVRELTGHDGVPSDVGIATTGVAGPDVQDGKPVGTVFIAVVTPSAARVEALALEGTRAQVRAEATRAALRIALETTV